jgi:penicillin-binding protein 1C
LFAKALDKGLITPTTLLPDVPTFIDGFSPKNFDLGYEGAIPSDQALARSLNIPFVHLLQKYNYEQFQSDLIGLGFSTISKDISRYGLSLILGGAELKLWDLSNTYTMFYQHLSEKPVSGISVMKSQQENDVDVSQISIWNTFKAMTQLVRPGMDKNWESFNSSQTIAWKTGTSIGFRDAWAVGLNGTVLVAVWVGNADGEGRAGLLGSTTAGAVAMELLNLSEHQNDWLDNLKPIAPQFELCATSGFIKGEHCPETIYSNLSENADRVGVCPFHTLYHVDKSGVSRVNSDCYPLHLSTPKVGFWLPPIMGYYYGKHHLQYSGMPPWLANCNEEYSPMEIIYPTDRSVIYIPKGANGNEKVIFQISHSDRNAEIFWHLDDEFLGITKTNHEQTIWLKQGEYKLFVTDAHGNSISRSVKIVSE